MNEIFNFKRFGTYFIADIKGCYRNYGLSLILLSLSGVIYYIISGLIGTIIGEGWETLISGITTLLIFIASSLAIVISMPHKCYGHITDRRMGASYILLPASTFEKFLSMIINSIVVIPAVFCSIFLGADAILAALDKEYVFCLTELSSNIDIIMSMLTPLDDFAGGILTFLLGAVYFRKHKIAKTILVMICAWIPLFHNCHTCNYEYDRIRLRCRLHRGLYRKYPKIRMDRYGHRPYHSDSSGSTGLLQIKNN